MPSKGLTYYNVHEYIVINGSHDGTGFKKRYRAVIKALIRDDIPRQVARGMF